MRKIILISFLFIVLCVKAQQTANTVIQNVINNKNKNFIKKALKSFQYNSYSKLLFTIDKTFIEGKIDSVFKIKKSKRIFTKLDSSNYFFKNKVDNQHYYISEKIAKHQYVNNKDKETILAAKMAGFKEPIYEFLALGVTNFSFYNDRFRLLGTDYVSPLAKKSLKDYQFTFDEFNDNEEIYIIKYKAINRKKSVGLEGELHIDKKSFSLIKSIAKVKGKVNVFVEQNFEYLEKEQIWFPLNTTIFLRKGASKNSIKTFRKLIGYRTNYFSDKNINPEDVSYILINVKNFNIKTNESVIIKKSDCAVQIDAKAIDRNNLIWNECNLASTNPKDLNTYTYLDSMVQLKRVDKKLNVLRKFMDGKFATKILDIDLSNVVNFNNHEGFRLGFGGTTNHNLSNKFKLSGYLAYGNKDKKLKYNYGLDFLLNKDTNTWLGTSFTNDIFETAKTKLLFSEPNFALINPRNLNISQFYTHKTVEVHLDHEISPRLTSKLQFNTGSYKNEFDYAYVSPAKNLTTYKLSNLSFAVNWTPFSTYLKSPKGKFVVKKSYPIVKAEITKSFNNLLDGNFNFLKFDLNIKHEIKTIKSGSTAFLLKAGLVSGEVPLSHLYNATPNHSLINPWRARINFSGTNAFETMLFNEFISDKFVSLQVRQNFEKFRIGKKFKPKLSLITRFVIGDIKNQEYHKQVTFKSLNKVYAESGFVLNQLFYGLGISSFYRYGGYKFNKFEDNLALKITYVIDLF